MASDSSSCRRLFLCGALVGFSPMMLLLFVGCCVYMASSDHDRTDEVTDPAPSSLPKIDPGAPVAELLPTPPKWSKAPVYLGEDLAGVPEVILEDTPPGTAKDWGKHKAHTAAAALHLNNKEEDGFLKALLSHRPDLAGVPFAMGGACRTVGDRARAFKEAAESVLSHKGAALVEHAPGPDEDGVTLEQFYQAHLAVVTQVLPAKSTSDQRALVRALSSVPRPEATRALARLAVFSPNQATRSEAIDALAIRREEAGSTEVFTAALNYPWPAVAENATRAIVKLKRKDLVGSLEKMLRAPDPRGPRTEIVSGGRKETVAHELVRVNHLRNCLLCHAPAERGSTSDETLVAEVPVPAQSLPEAASGTSGYGSSESPLLVRVDVTYLRQDFSALQNVTDWTADSWGQTQRFDFLVRRRVLSPDEAAELSARLKSESPYRRAAARALQELTGAGRKFGSRALQ
jgi:hypothetical protein